MNTDTTSLASMALDLVVTNQITKEYNVSNFKNSGNGYWNRYHKKITPDTKQFSYSTICSCSQKLQGVQESTSTLLSARTLMKANHTEECWARLETLFSAQASNGFLPKYVYFPDQENEEENIIRDNNNTDPSQVYYYDKTMIPTPELFNYTMPKPYHPCPQDEGAYAQTCFNLNEEYTFVHELNITSSGRLSAIPIHATNILEIFYISNQTYADLVHLEFYFQRVYKMHSYWMDNVMKHCNSDDKVKQQGPCYNIVHPWESLVATSSPQWDTVLNNIAAVIKEEQWVPNPGMMPDYVQANDSVFKAMMYLFECHSNVTHNHETETQSKMRGGTFKQAYESKLIHTCPFAMIDLSHLSLLLKSHHDLYQIGKILRESYSKKVPTKNQLDTMDSWIDRTTKLNEELWSEEYGRYVSKNLLFSKNQSSEVIDYMFDAYELVDSHNAADLMPGWFIEANSSRFNSAIVSPLLDRNSEFSFNCGSHPIWSWACSKNGAGAMDSIATSPSISPSINYWLSLGLVRNGAEGLGNYIQESTIELMCSNSYNHGSLRTRTCSDLTFSEAYNAHTGLPQTNLSICDSTSTIAGSVFYNLIVPDKPFYFEPSPPIQNGWIIVLVVAEIAIAFSIGVSCLLLSLNLMRRLKKDADEHELMQLVRDQSREENTEEGEPEDVANGEEAEGEDTLSSLFRRFMDD